MIVDLLIIAFFVASPVLREWPSFLWVDLPIAARLIADISARSLAANDVPRWLRQPTTITEGSGAGPGHPGGQPACGPGHR